jgi:hypothetical protein
MMKIALRLLIVFALWQGGKVLLSTFMAPPGSSKIQSAQQRNQQDVECLSAPQSQACQR